MNRFLKVVVRLLSFLVVVGVVSAVSWIAVMSLKKVDTFVDHLDPFDRIILLSKVKMWAFGLLAAIGLWPISADLAAWFIRKIGMKREK